MEGGGVTLRRAAQTVLSTYVGQLADCIRLYCNVVLLQLLLNFIDALGDVLCLKGGKKVLKNCKCPKQSRKQPNTRGRPVCDSAGVQQPDQARPQHRRQASGCRRRGRGEGGRRWGDGVSSPGDRMF